MDSKLILGVDSTATTASVALRRDGVTLKEISVNAGNTHSVTLLPMIEEVIKECSVTLDGVDVFGLSIGPGSFTGVRIGAAVVKGLAFKDSKPVVGVPTLEALAYNLVNYKGYICPCMNARREQVYTALFKSDGEKLVRLWEDTAISVAELSEKLKKSDKTPYFVGDGYFLVENLTDKVTPEALRWQSGASVAAVAEAIYNNSNDKTFSPDAAVPVYLRKPQAEREREERLKNND